MNLLVQAQMTRVGRHSHNRSWNLPHQQPMANRLFIGEKAPRNRFIDNYDLRRSGSVLSGEGASGAHLDAHRLKVFGTDEIDIDHRLLSLLIRRTPFDLKQSAGVSSFQRS